MSRGFVSNMLSWSRQKLSSLTPSSILPSSSKASEPDTTVTDLKELKELKNKMKWVQTIARNAKQRGAKDAEKLRLQELKDVAYDAEDVVDEYKFEVLSAKIRAGIYVGDDNYKRKREDEVMSSQLIVPVPSELATRVKEIRARFDRIIREWDDLGWSEGESHAQDDVDMVTLNEGIYSVHEPSIYGRDNDKEIIIEKIISGDSDSDHTGVGFLSVLPLVGMGGIGKTTLAQLVYDDQRVCDYFPLRAWVYVSEKFSLQIITRNIIESFTTKACDFTVLHDLQKVLANEVKGKRFLVILDDVWNEKPSVWHALKAPLIGGFGTIIVTTRNDDVAQYMQTMDSYTLPFLSFQDSWSLFKQLAFECQNPNPDLLEIGKKIVEKCQGLPLAVKLLGSQLRLEVEENWQEILDSETWKIQMMNSKILPALTISYDRLPGVLKQCFVFLSLFPKGYIIREDDIVSLWSSQGLVHPEGRKSVEDKCVGYVHELLQRSLLQLSDGPEGSLLQSSMVRISDGPGRCFIMHDLVNDLAQSVSGKEFSRTETDNIYEVLREVRYISIISDLNHNISLQYLNHLRAPRLLKVLNIDNGFIDGMAFISPELFQILKHVRALDFRRSDIQILDDSIGKLKQLRYLNISRTKIEKLPDSICDLYNLQTLDLHCSSIKELPIRISSLVNLKQLIVNPDTCIPRGIGKLLKLEILPFFSVDSGTWHCALGELKNLVNLKGELLINGLRYVTTLEDAMDASLCSKSYLKKLTLNWYGGESCHHSNEHQYVVAKPTDEQLLEALRPHANIEELELSNYCGFSYPSWLGDESFSKLVKFALTGTFRTLSPSLPTLGQLPSLEDILIDDMCCITFVGREFCSHDSESVGFRSLKTLKFKSMYNWMKWSNIGNGDFCSLHTLTLAYCYRLGFIPEPLCSSLCTLEVSRCPMLKAPRTLPSLNCLILSREFGEFFSDDNLYLPSLKTLKVSYSWIISLVLHSRNLPSIELIEIERCEELEKVVGLRNLNSLKELRLTDCPKLHLASDELLPHRVHELPFIGAHYFMNGNNNNNN